MIEVRKASHCAYKIRYHMVFSIKYRRKLLRDNDRINYIKSICSEIGERYWFDFDAVGTDGDHVHIFVGAAPRYSPSKVMQIVKSITARSFSKNSLKSGNSFGVVNFGVTVVISEQWVMVLWRTQSAITLRPREPLKRKKTINR